MPPPGKGEVAGNDPGSRTKLRFQLSGKPPHDIGEEIAKYYIGIPDIHVPEIAPPYLNPFHPQGAESRQRVDERIHLEPQRPDTIASLRFPENPSIPTADVDQKVTGLHWYMIQERPHPDMRGRVEHGALGDGEHGHKGKGKQHFKCNETSYYNESNDNPGRHIFSS